MRDLMQHDYVPSFCTSCYRKGRTGEQFMEFAIPGFIEKFCTPNAVLTLGEYLEDYASPETKREGEALIERELDRIEDAASRERIRKQLREIRENEIRDVYV